MPGRSAFDDLSGLAKELTRKYRYKKYRDIVAATEGLVAAYRAQLDVEDPFTGSPLNRAVGHCLDLRGLSCRRLGDVPDAMLAFRMGHELCHSSHARIDLAEMMCYHSGDLEEARKLARWPVGGDDSLWFRKVKIDAFASLQLGDVEQAQKCYRLLHDKYAGLRDAYLDEARAELAERNDSDDNDDAVQRILSWLGRVAPLTDQRKNSNRRWWNALEPGWHSQLRVLACHESGKDARDRAARSKQPLDDKTLAYVLRRKEVRLNTDYPVETLAPLSRFEHVRKLKVNYWKKPTEFFAPIGKLAGLRRLEVTDNEIRDLGFVKRCSELEVLLASSNEIASLAGIEACQKLETLSVGGNALRDIEPIAHLAALRTLHCSSGDLASLAPLEGLELDTLTCRFNALTSLASLRHPADVARAGDKRQHAGDPSRFAGKSPVADPSRRSLGAAGVAFARRTHHRFCTPVRQLSAPGQ